MTSTFRAALLPFLLLLLAATLLPWSTNAQTAPPVAYQPQLISYPGVPFGPCDIYQVALNVSNGNYYSCTPGTRTWTLLAGGVQNVALAPSGACVAGGLQQVTSSGLLYSCQSNVWVLVNTGTSGAGAPTNPCATGLAYTDNTTGNYYSCNAGTWLLVGPQTTSSGPSCTTDTFTATPTYTFGNDQCHIMTLTGNVTSITIAGSPANKQILYLKFPQDGTGGRTVTFPGSFVLPTGFSLGITANHQNNMAWQFDGTLWRPLTDFGGGGGGGNPGGINHDTQCNTAGSFGACVNQPSTLYVSTTGNDSNDGTSWDKSKLTIMAAVCALPGGSCSASPKKVGGGTVYFTSGVFCNSNTNGGCWIASSGDSQYPNMTSAVSGPTAWETFTNDHINPGLSLICASKDSLPTHGNTTSCSVKGPSQSISPGSLPLFWITGNSFGIYVDGLSGQGAGGGFSGSWGRVGIDSATTEIIGTPTVTQTSSVTLNNITTGEIAGAGCVGCGPMLAIGNGFWVHLHDFQTIANYSEACNVSSVSRSSNVVTVTTTGCGSGAASCPFLTGDHLSIKDVTGGAIGVNGTFTAASGCSGGSTVTFNQTGPTESGFTVSGVSTIADDRAFGMVLYDTQTEMARLHSEGSGIKYYGGPNSNLQMHDNYMEGSGTLNQPFVWESPLIYGGGGNMELSGLQPADTGTLPSVINENTSCSAVATNGQNTPLRGQCILINSTDSTVRTTGLLASGQSGWYTNQYFESQNDIARRAGSPSAVLGTNQANPNYTSWTNTASGNGCTSGFTCTTGKTDPFGGSNAVELDSSGGSVQVALGTTGSIALTVGDVWEFGVWVRSTGTSVNNPAATFILNYLGAGSGDLCSSGSGNVIAVTQYSPADGNWFWVSGTCTIATNPANANIALTVSFTVANPIQVYRPIVIKIPAASTLSATEKVDEFNSVVGATSTSASAGDVAFLPGQKFCLPSSSFTNEFCGYEIHSNTANRTYTFPDASGTILLTSTITVPWSSITNPTANETLTMGSNLSEFDFTTSLSNAFKWANTTAATSGTSQSSPVLAVCGNAWHAGASNQDCWTLTHAPGNGVDATITDTYGHTGSSTGVINSAFPGPVISGAPNPAGLAGAVILPQGTTNSTTAAAVTIQGGTGITPYTLSLPNVAPAAGGNFLSCTSATNSICTWAGGANTLGSNVNVWYLAKNANGGCPASLVNCTTIFGDTQYINDATSNSTTTVTCPNSDCNFVAGDVGKTAWGVTNTTVATQGIANYETIVCPVTTIASVTNANTVVLTAACTASGTANVVFVWGHRDGSTLHALDGNGMPCLDIEPFDRAVIMVDQAEFITPATCTQQAAFSGKNWGRAGGISSAMIMTPDFNFATCTGNGGSHTGNHVCFGSGLGQVNDLFIWGNGLKASFANCANASGDTILAANPVGGGMTGTNVAGVCAGETGEGVELNSIDENWVGGGSQFAMSQPCVITSAAAYTEVLDCRDDFSGGTSGMVVVSGGNLTDASSWPIIGLSVNAGGVANTRGSHIWGISGICGVTVNGQWNSFGDIVGVEGGAEGSPQICLGNGNGNAQLANTTIKSVGLGPAIQFGVNPGSFFFSLGGNQILAGGSTNDITGFTPGTNISGVDIIQGSCTGVVTSASTIGLYNLGNNSTTTCTSTTTNLGPVMGRAGTMYAIQCLAGVAGNQAADACTVLKNNVATTLTCSLNGATWCLDGSHQVTYAAGDIITVKVVSGTSTTLSGVKASVITW